MASKQATLSQSGESVTNQQHLKTIDLELLGERIRQARTDQKISQRDLCKGLFTSAYLSYVELGKTRPTLTNLGKLAERLNKPVDYFLRSSGLMTSPKPRGGLDREQLRNLELQCQLLQSRVALSGNDFGQVEHVLGTIRPFLARLSKPGQAQFYLLEGEFYNALIEPEAALISLEAARFSLEGIVIAGPATTELELETGITYGKLDQHFKALEHFHNGIGRLKLAPISPNNGPLYRKLLWETSRCFLALGDPEKAFEYSQRLLDLPNETRKEKAGNLFKEGVRLAGLGDYQQACFYLGRSEQAWQEIKESSALQDLTLETAEIHFEAKKYKEAYQVAQLAYRLVPGYPDDVTKAAELKVLLLLVQITLSMDDLVAVKTYMEQAEQIFMTLETDDPLDKARYFYIAGNAFARLDNWEQANDFYHQALEMLEPLVERDGHSASRLVLAEVYYNSSQLLKKHNNSVKALEYLDKAFRLRSK